MITRLLKLSSDKGKREGEGEEGRGKKEEGKKKKEEGKKKG
jgi:hypothetical protein